MKPKRRRKAISLAPVPLGGDHGSGTTAAIVGTVIEPITDEKGRNPNNMGRRVRKDAYKVYNLTMRQEQAAKCIRDAYCRVEMQSSGSPLTERVQSSPKPDATIDRQVDAVSKLIHATRRAGTLERMLFEHVLRDNQHIRSFKRGNPVDLVRVFKRALDQAADQLRY